MYNSSTAGIRSTRATGYPAKAECPVAPPDCGKRGRMTKKSAGNILLVLLALCLLASACAKAPVDGGEQLGDTLQMTQEDQELIAEIGDDVHLVADDDFAKTIQALAVNTAAWEGTVYEVEGLLTYVDVHGEAVPYVYRNYAPNNGEKTQIGIQLRYLTGEPAEGTWIRVVGIVALEEHDGHAHAVLDVIAAETTKTMGKTTVQG